VTLRSCGQGPNGQTWSMAGAAISGEATIIMPMFDNDIPSGLENTVNYRFTDRQLLAEALTHRSFLNESGEPVLRDNERLEFFGDAVIDFILSRMLLDRFPDSREGDLTRIRASLVGEENLANLARRIGLGGFLRMGRGEEKSGGREKRSILADAYEALVAAVYLDGGAAPVKELVEAHFGPLLEAGAAGSVARDCKTELQELAQARYGTVPRYIHLPPEGPDHDRVFTVQAFVGDRCLGTGKGRSKKEAEQEAARSGLALLTLDSASAAS
jgi:ribonuclease III